MPGWNRTLFFDLNVLARPPPSVPPQTCQVWGAILPAVHPNQSVPLFDENAGRAGLKSFNRLRINSAKSHIETRRCLASIRPST